MKNTGVDYTKFVMLFHWHVALDTVIKNNHGFCTDNTRYLLHFCIQKLHEMFIVV